MDRVKTILRCASVVTLAASTALVAASAAYAQNVPTIRVGWTMPAEDAKYWLRQRPEEFPALGSQYNIEWVQFQGTAPMVQAMIANALDCSTQGPLSLANGYLEGGLETYVVADHVGTAPGSFAPYWAVLEDSDIQDVEDLRGRTVGINVLGSGLYGPLALWLQRGGLDPRRDVRIVETGFPGSEDALRANRVDAAVMNQPFAARAEAAGGIRPLFSVADVAETTVQILEACSKSFVDSQPELAALYVRDLTEAMDRALADREETIRVASEVTMTPVEVFETFYLTDQDFARTPGAAPNFEVLQEMLDLYHEAGMTSGAIDAAVFQHPEIVAPLR